MGLRGIGANPIAIRPTAEVLANRTPQPWEKKGLSRAERVAVFLETLPVSSGSQRGTNFKVRDWQWKEIIEPIYATNADGRRFVREAVISLPRKNGKTGIVAGLALCHLVGPEAVERGQVFSAANAKKQSGLIFNEIEAIINRRKWMKERLNVQRFLKKIEDVGITGSTYESMASEVHTEHGLSTYFWIYDELGQTKDGGDLYRVLSTSGGAWEEPLGIIISTQAASSMHIMSELIDDGLQIRNGIVDDPSRYACVFAAPVDADPWSEETWHACNPALGDFRSLEDMRDFAKKAKRIPAQESTFRNLFLNQRVAREVKWIPPSVWELCGQEPVEFAVESLKDRECYAALDLSGSGKNDLTALSLLFPVEDQWKILPFFWCAEVGLEEAEHRDRVPYRSWAEQGHIIAVPGAVFDFKGVAQKIGELATQYKIKLMAVDPWAFDKMRIALDELGIDLQVKVHGQNIKDMDPAVRATENAIIAGKLRHNKNPILTWCINNVNLLTDSSGNRKLDKRKSTGRIDGAVAMAMACNLAASLIPSEPSYQVMFV